MTRTSKAGKYWVQIPIVSNIRENCALTPFIFYAPRKLSGKARSAVQDRARSDDQVKNTELTLNR